MERILREPESRMKDSVYLKVTVAGKSPEEVNKAFFYLDITDEIDKIVSERYGSSFDDKSIIDFKNFYLYLTQELKLSYFLKGKKNVRYTCLELEGELYADNIDIYEFKRFVLIEWGEIVKIGHDFFGVNKRECHVAVGNEFFKRKVNNTRKITEDNDINDVPPQVQTSPSPPQVPNIPDPFPSNKPSPTSVPIAQENKNIPNPFDNDGNIKGKRSKVVKGEW